MMLRGFVNGESQLIYKEEYERLSDYSQVMLNSKQQMIEWISDNRFILVIVPIIIGVILIIYASYKWRQNQKEIDEQERLRTEKKRLEIQDHMSKEEVNAKVVSKIIMDNTDTLGEEERNINSNIIEESIRSEDMCFDYLEATYEKNYDYKFIRRVKIGLCEYDLIAKNKDDLGDMLFEVKFGLVDTRMINRKIDDMRRSRTYYCESTGRIAMGYVVIVIDADGQRYDDEKNKIMSVQQPADVRVKVVKTKDLIDYQNKNGS